MNKQDFLDGYPFQFRSIQSKRAEDIYRYYAGNKKTLYSRDIIVNDTQTLIYVVIDIDELGFTLFYDSPVNYVRVKIMFNNLWLWSKIKKGGHQ